jgi:hypothetical protein
VEVGVRNRIFSGHVFRKRAFRVEVFFNRAAVEGKGKLRVLVKAVMKWKGRRGGMWKFLEKEEGVRFRQNKRVEGEGKKEWREKGQRSQKGGCHILGDKLG